MGLVTFRRRSGVPHRQAASVWQLFDRHFCKFNDWQTRLVAQARRRGWITTRYGWKARVVTATGTTTLYNWGIQSGASDVLRIAVILAAQAGFELLTTCHDSLLVSVPEAEAETRCTALTHMMEEAAEIAVGVRIKVDVQVIRPGMRMLNADTAPLWNRIIALLDEGKLRDEQ